MPKDTVSVRLDGTRLTVRGEKPARTGRARVAEREVGPFAREFIVPFQVKVEAIAARLVDGVLTVTLPRSDADKAKEIKIE